MKKFNKLTPQQRSELENHNLSFDLTYIWLIFMVNVGTVNIPYISYMDAMG